MDYRKEKRSMVEGKRQEVKKDLRTWVKVYASGHDVSLTCKALVLVCGASRVNPAELIKGV